MAISKGMLAALRALSAAASVDVEKSYKLERAVQDVVKRHYVRPPLYKAWNHLVPCGDHQVPVRLFTHPDGLLHPVILYFHGGGWVTGNVDTYDRVCTDLARLTGHVVVSVDYRLAPEHPFPQGLEDCYAVAKLLYQNSRILFAKPEQITLMGDSAGGNLAAAVSLLARDRGEFAPPRQILLYPAVYNDYSEASPFPSVKENGTDYILTAKRVEDFMELYQSSPEDRRNPYFAPLLAEDLSRQPRTLILTAQYCPLRDEGEEYGRRLAQAGNRVEVCRIPDALHGYFSLGPRYAAVRRSYEIINRFLEEVQYP